MQTVEITAKTVQDATNSAAEKLGVASDQLRVTVLEETKGLFGKSNVRVRAEIIEKSPVVPPTPTPSEQVAAPAVATKPGRGKKTPAVEPVAAPTVAVPAEMPVVEPPAQVKDPRRGRGRKPEPASSAPVTEGTSSEVAVLETADEPEVQAEVVATQKDAEALVALIRELLDAAQLTVTAEIGSVSGRYVNITLDGKDVAFIVGKHGEVLNAMQYLVNIVASRRIQRGVRATLDGNDYRKRREEALTQLAQRIAEQVKKRGEEAVLDALPAFERRIVHKALGEIDGITTYSEGEEPNRRVVIAPID